MIAVGGLGASGLVGESLVPVRYVVAFATAWRLHEEALTKITGSPDDRITIFGYRY